LRGTAIGVYSSIQFLGIFLGGAVGGILAHSLGLAAVLWFGAALTAAWLAVAAGMRSPAATRTVTVNEAGASADSTVHPSKA
jgi:predicted MFS family arabinose efflux permease